MTSSKKVIINNLMIGATLLNGVNPIFVSANTGLQNQSPTIEMVSEPVAETEMEQEKKIKSGRKNQEASASETTIIQNEQGISRDLPTKIDTFVASTLSWSGLSLSLNDGILTIPEGIVTNPETFSEMLRRQGLNLKDVTKIVFAGSLKIVGSASGIFSGLTQLKDIEGLTFLDTAAVTNMSSFFSDCVSLENVDLSNFDTSNVTRMDHMFFACKSLTEVDLTPLETGNVTLLNHMFQSAMNLKKVDMSTFDTSNVKDIEIMFADCQNLEEVIFGPGWDTSNVAYFYAVFYNCQNLKQLDLSMFNTQNVTSMDRMFANCYSLEELILSSGWNTSNVKSFYGMFVNNNSLKNLDVSMFTTPSATSISLMFAGCSELEKLDLRGFDNRNISASAPSFFEEMSNLKEIYLPESFVFHGKGSEQLITPPQNDIFTGYWKHVGEGSVNNPTGVQLSAIDLMATYDSTLAGTWVWERQAGQIIVQHVGNNGQLLKEEVIDGYRGLEYETNHQTFEGYTWDNQFPENWKGVYAVDTPTVIYQYQKNEELIDQLEISADPVAEWLANYSSNTINKIQPKITLKGKSEVLSLQKLEELGLSVSLELLEPAQHGVNIISLKLTDGKSIKETTAKLYLAIPRASILDTKFVKPSEKNNVSLIDQLAHDTVTVDADFGETVPEEVFSTLLSSFKAISLSDKKVVLEIKTGNSTIKEETTGALIEGENDWILSNERHYGAVAIHPTYQINSDSHINATHDTLSDHIDLYQATIQGKHSLNSSQEENALQFDEKHVEDLRQKSTPGEHQISFDFGHIKSDIDTTSMSKREGTGQLVVTLENNMDQKEETQKFSPDVNDSIKKINDINENFNDLNSFGKFGEDKKEMIGILGFFSGLGALILYLLKRSK